MPDDDPRPSVDGPTAMSPTSGQLHGGPPAEGEDAGHGAAAGAPTDERTKDTHEPADEDAGRGAGVNDPAGGPLTPDNGVDGPTAHSPRAELGSAHPGEPWARDHPDSADPPTSGGNDSTNGPPPSGTPAPTEATSSAELVPRSPLASPAGSDGPTAFIPAGEDWSGDDAPTLDMAATGGWPFDQFESPPDEPVRRPEAPLPATRRPAYYVALGAALALVAGLVAVAVVVAVSRSREVVAGDAVAQVPAITGSSQAPAPPSTTTAAAPTTRSPFAELAAHPLSSSTTRMPDTTCALPRFDPADDRQAAFYVAAKACADDAWRPVLHAANLDGAVTVVTLTQAVQTQTCGELTPTSPPTECDGTVYLTPAYLRDTEHNGRYPGRYLGVFLREYARALQHTTGVDELVAKASGSAADLDTKVDQQATCLAGVVSGAMAGRGAIDGNITGEIRARLTTVDAPPDAQSWLDKGFQQRTPAACDVWA